MKFIKTTTAVILLGLLSGVSATYAHDRDDDNDYRYVQHRDRDDHRNYGYRHDDDYRWREYRRHERWEWEHRQAYNYNRGRDWDDRGQRVVIGLPLPPLVLPPPPAVVLKRLPAPPVVILPRPY